MRAIQSKYSLETRDFIGNNYLKPDGIAVIEEKLGLSKRIIYYIGEKILNLKRGHHNPHVTKWRKPKPVNKDWFNNNCPGNGHSCHAILRTETWSEPGYKYAFRRLCHYGHSSPPILVE